MTDDLERRLRDTFAPPAASREHVVRSALASEGDWRRPPAVLVGLVVLAIGVAGLLALRLASPEPEIERMTITNSDRVITVVEPSGHVWLVGTGTARERSSGGVILSFGGKI